MHAYMNNVIDIRYGGNVYYISNSNLKKIDYDVLKTVALTLTVWQKNIFKTLTKVLS